VSNHRIRVQFPLRTKIFFQHHTQTGCAAHLASNPTGKGSPLPGHPINAHSHLLPEFKICWAINQRLLINYAQGELHIILAVEQLVLIL